MASSIDATKPITGNPTTLSVRDNFSAAKTEIEALQTDKADLASPALTGTATAVNLTVSGTLTASGTADLSGATLSLPNDATISAAANPTFVVKDSDAATEDTASGWFEVQAAAAEVAVRYGADGLGAAMIEVDPDNGLLGLGELRVTVSGNPVMHVDADGVGVGAVVGAEPPADFDNKSFIVYCPFDDGMTLYNTNTGFGDLIGINFVGGDAAADTDYGTIRYDLGDGNFEFLVEGTQMVRIHSLGLTVEGVANSSIAINSSNTTGTCQLNFGDSAAANQGYLHYDHTNEYFELGVGGVLEMVIDNDYCQHYHDVRIQDNSKLQVGNSQDCSFWHNGTNNYIDMSVGDLIVRDGTTTRFTFARTTGDFTATGNVTAYSDMALKKDLVVIEDALDKLSQLTGYTYTRKDTGERQTGLIAQDVQRVLPEAVSQAPDGTLALAYGNLLGLVVNAVNALVDRVEALEAKETK